MFIEQIYKITLLSNIIYAAITFIEQMNELTLLSCVIYAVIMFIEQIVTVSTGINHSVIG